MFKLKIRITRPPVSIFELREGKDEIDRTEYYEHGWHDAEHLFWDVPDGKYMICQGREPPCIVMVKKGKMTTWERNGKPAGNNVESKPKFSTENADNDVGGILHVHHAEATAKTEDVVVVVDNGEPPANKAKKP